MKDRITWKWLAALVAIMILLNAKAGRAGPDAAGDDAAIAPFLDENAFAVARVEMDKVDAGALKDWVMATLDVSKLDAKQAAGMKQQLGEPFNETGKWIDGFKKAGGKRLYVIASLADIPQEPPFIVVPLEKGAAAGAMIDLFIPGGPKKRGGQPQPNGIQSQHAEKIGDVVVFGAGSTLDRLKNAVAAQERPELAKAMAAAGDAPVRIAVIPSEAQRQMFEAIAPELPKELGGGPAKAVSRGVQWGAIWAHLPPDASAQLVIEAQDADNAKTLREIADKGIAALRDHAKDMPFDMDGLTKLLSPKVEGNRLVIALDAGKSKELASAVLLPGLMQARQNAERVRSASNMRQLLLGTIMYANDNKNTWPDKLDQITKYLGDEKFLKTVMVNPQRPEQTPGYTYRKPEGQGGGRTVVMYETYTQWPAGGINVGFADGHVEWVSNEQQFKRMLEGK
jgi:prepilin-type processing-associated H-X9-DG protein